MLELDSGLEFHPNQDAEFFSLLPAKAAVCLIFPREEAAEPYLIRTADLRRRLQRLLGPPDATSKRLNLREFAKLVRYRETGSAFEQAVTYYQNAKAIFPQRYRQLMRLRPAPVLKVNLRNEYPRCFVTRRIVVNEQGEPSVWRVLWAICVAPFRGVVRGKDAGLFQSAALPDQNPARSHFSRLLVFGNEDVPGAVFRGLLQGRVRRGSEPLGAISGYQ